MPITGTAAAAVTSLAIAAVGTLYKPPSASARRYGRVAVVPRP